MLFPVYVHKIVPHAFFCKKGEFVMEDAFSYVNF